MIRMKITVHAEKAIRRMEDMERRSKNFRPVLQWAKRELEKANIKNFTTSGLPVGGWSPLDPKYAAWKAIHYPGAPILQQNGKLFRDLANLNNSASHIEATKATFGTDIEYAKFHQYGTSRMAKRRIVYEPPLFARNLAERSAKYVVDGKFRS